MKNFTRKLVSAGALMLAASGVQAATISDFFANPEEVTEINQTGMLDRFDSTIGTLLGAKLTLRGYATSSITLTNNAAQNQTVRADGSLLLSFTATGVPLVFADPAITLNLDYTGGAVTLAASEVRTFGPVTDDQQVVVFDSNAAGIFEQAGGGQFAISCESLTGLNLLGGGGNVTSAQSTTAGCGATIEYEFTPRQQVPSPAPLSLLAIGLLGIAGLQRARK